MSAPRAATEPGRPDPFAAFWPKGGGGRLEKLAGAAAVAKVVAEGVKFVKNKVDERRQYVIRIHEFDDIYPDLIEWLSKQIPARERRALQVRTTRHIEVGRRGDSIAMDSPGPGPMARRKMVERARLYVLYDGMMAQKVTIGGHSVVVRVDAGEAAISRSGGDTTFKMVPDKMVFTATDPAGLEAVTAFMQEIADARLAEPMGSRLYIARWGSWQRRDDLPGRDLETVVLAKGQKEEVVADIQQFLDDEEVYARLGQPYHRGYAFHGPPGSGKSTLARALATHFGFDLYYLPLGDIEADVNLLSLVSQVPAGSALLLEDIDVYHAAKKRDDADQSEGTDVANKASLSGLLNATDGVATPHGLILFVTSNRYDKLDDALVREGRIHLPLELGYVDTEQLSALIETFLDRTLNIAVTNPEVVASNITTRILKHRDPEAALKAIREYVTG